MVEPLLIARSGTAECHLLPGLANRHGLITGATGTGKTVTLQALAEGFSRIGVSQQGVRGGHAQQGDDRVGKGVHGRHTCVSREPSKRHVCTTTTSCCSRATTPPESNAPHGRAWSTVC